MPHPGGLPSLGEAREPEFVRTNTSQSVFTPTGASAVPAQHMPRTRNRAQTVGGIPSPYEVPEQNGNTLPRGDRPSTAHATHHGNVFQMGSSAIPPPPAHSPPPLTHSSMEIRARMGDDVFSPTGQHTLPRSMGSSRSYSVTSNGSSGRGGGASVGMRHMKSDGHLPHLPLLETHEEKMVYIQPPLDSSAEASIHSAGSYGHGREEVGGGERRVSPHHQQQQHQHRRFQGQPPQHSMRQPNPNTATYVAESESFSEMTSEAGSIHSGIPRMPTHHHAHHYSRERSNQSHGRESVFSETSTELSVSSSEKEMSPSKYMCSSYSSPASSF